MMVLLAIDLKIRVHLRCGSAGSLPINLCLADGVILLGPADASPPSELRLSADFNESSQCFAKNEKRLATPEATNEKAVWVEEEALFFPFVCLKLLFLKLSTHPPLIRRENCECTFLPCSKSNNQFNYLFCLNKFGIT